MLKSMTNYLPAELARRIRILTEEPCEINEIGNKCAAELLLLDSRRRIFIPTYEEWLGFNQLERDDQLKRRSNEVSRHP